jgi:DNA processing protein
MLAPVDTARARAILARTPDLSSAQLQALMRSAAGEAPRAVSAAGLRSAELTAAARAHLHAPDAAAIDADLDWLSKSGAVILLCSDAGYPPLLAQSAQAPAALYVLGAPQLLADPQLAMIGSRSPTTAGRATAREFAAWFARAGLTVTSGLGVGIDAASHEGALHGGGTTIAVCGTALDRVYPAEHAALAARIRAHGALVSQLPPRTKAERQHFVQRNRIIGGLALGTLVVEAARLSAAVQTARLAGEYGREVFAIPGSIHSPLSRGCHQLIRDGAKLVEQATDVLAELRISFPKEELTAQQSPQHAAPALDKEYEMLLDALALEPATIDIVSARTHLPSESVASMLLILELQGRVVNLPGGRYGRTP